MTSVDRILGGLTGILATSAGILVIAMMLHISADVFSKYLFNHPLDGTLEIVSHYYMVGLIFLPLAYVQRRGSHIVAEIFTQNLRRRALAGLEGAIGMLMCAYVVMFVWTTTDEAIAKTIEHEFLEATESFIVIWPTRWFLPISFGAMGLYALVQCVRNLRRAASDRPLPGDTGEEA